HRDAPHPRSGEGSARPASGVYVPRAGVDHGVATVSDEDLAAVHVEIPGKIAAYRAAPQRHGGAGHRRARSGGPTDRDVAHGGDEIDAAAARGLDRGAERPDAARSELRVRGELSHRTRCGRGVLRLPRIDQCRKEWVEAIDRKIAVHSRDD